jgi:protein-L-isoaspartate(D-aspartate) O-methyltransferase
MNTQLDAAFNALPRENFLPANIVKQADKDIPLPIGFGQTNSQPSTVYRMLQWLDIEAGQKILDVGSGSGWTSALLAYLTGPAGEVVAVDIIPELVQFGRENNERMGINNVTFLTADNDYGSSKYAPYDRILVSASADELPYELIEQLAREGEMIIPVKNTILVIKKDELEHIHKEEKPGYLFVPLVHA